MHFCLFSNLEVEAVVFLAVHELDKTPLLLILILLLLVFLGTVLSAGFYPLILLAPCFLGGGEAKLFFWRLICKSNVLAPGIICLAKFSLILLCYCDFLIDCATE